MCVCVCIRTCVCVGVSGCFGLFCPCGGHPCNSTSHMSLVSVHACVFVCEFPY